MSEQAIIEETKDKDTKIHQQQKVSDFLTEPEDVVVKKVVVSAKTARKLKAIGVLFENELEYTKEPYLLGKGIEKVLEKCKDVRFV